MWTCHRTTVHVLSESKKPHLDGRHVGGCSLYPAPLVPHVGNGIRLLQVRLLGMRLLLSAGTPYTAKPECEKKKNEHNAQIEAVD